MAYHSQLTHRSGSTSMTQDTLHPSGKLISASLMVCCGSSTTIRLYVRIERKHSYPDAKVVIIIEIAKYENQDFTI